MVSDYILDYAVGQFVLWNPKTRYEVDISEENALKMSMNNNVKVTKDAEGMLNTIAEDLNEQNEIFNGVGL
jgi:dihydrodipicolinate synthase/N-acetylneuraminate lyase